MKKILVFLVLAALSWSAIAWAEELPGLPGLAREGDRVVGSMDIGRNYRLQVDMPLPKAVEGPVRQYKMRRIQISTPDIRALLSGRTQPPLEGEAWEIWTMERTECRQFLYQEASMTYGTFYPPFAPLPLSEGSSDPTLALAEAQALSLLQAWGIPYAYPFYQVCNAARGADVSLRDAPLHTGDDLGAYLLDAGAAHAQTEYDYNDQHRMFDDEYSIVRVRQEVDGIPFAIGDIKSPAYRPDNPQYDEGVYLLLQCNGRGEIVFADACNLHTVVAEAGDPLPVLGWQECLAALPRDNPFFDRLLEAKVIGAELCYAIGGKRHTYPVWQFLVEFKQPADSSLQQYLCFPQYVDARSGLPL